jgi:thioredoxin-dependent peroxiredoxin
MAELHPGDAAPEFALFDQNGMTIRLADYRGRKLLVYFYPKADTPGCTTQASSIRDARTELVDLGLAGGGFGPEASAPHQRLDHKSGLAFPLLSDRDHAVAEANGVWGEKTSFGKTSLGIIRSSFLVDEQGVIFAAWYKVSPEDTVPKAMAALK